MTLTYMIFFLITILISVAFFTLFERKILGYIHARVGPNKILLSGVGQPFSDLIKLFSSMDISLSFSSLFLYNFSPIFMVLFSMLVWCFFYSKGNSNSFKYFLLVMMVMNGLLTFFFLFPGWSSGSVYSMMGSYRSSAQCISYEGVFFFCIMIMIFMFFSFNFLFTTLMLNICSCIMVMMPVIFPWLVSIMAESNRTPFDFAEGESELVSGFNTEYGSGGFSIIFLSEYMSMLFYSFFTAIFVFGKSSMSLFSFFFFLMVYIWVRTAFPRLRYDKLMLVSWKSLMFLVTGLMLLYLNIFLL